MKLHSATWFSGKKPGSEDDLFAIDSASVMVVVDGVTRDVCADGSYPDPSPARVVAQTVARVIGRQLVDRATVTEKDIQDAFSHGNQAAKMVNEELGLWRDHDYLGRDLAGAVASCAVIRDGHMLWGYIGDCGAALLGNHGCILWRTPDDVATVRPLFPKLAADASPQDRQARTLVVRRDFRNKPDASHRTYGVLTGEPLALSYVKVGCWPIRSTDLAAVYTDGVTPILVEDSEFRSLLVRGDAAGVVRRFDSQAQALRLDDEKTIVFSAHS